MRGDGPSDAHPARPAEPVRPAEPARPAKPVRPARPVTGPRAAVPGSVLVDRAVGLVRAIDRGVVRLGVLALLGGIIIWAAVSRAEDPGPLALVLVALLLLAPPVMLFLFATALRALAALPRRLRETPGAIGDRLGQVRRRVAEVDEARRRGFIAAIRSIVRLGLSVASSREVLELSPALVFLTPGMAMATLVAAGVAILEILGGVIALFVLALS